MKVHTSVWMAALLISALLLGACAGEAIGTIRGAELDELVIGSTVYIRDCGDEYQSFSSADRGSFLGTVTGGDETFRVYAVEGDAAQDFLYVRWDWEGISMSGKKSSNPNNQRRRSPSWKSPIGKPRLPMLLPFWTT